MNLRTRLIVGIVAIAVILLIPLAITLKSIEDAHDTTRGLGNNEFASSLLLGSIRASLDELRRSETALVFVHDNDSKARVKAQLDTLDRYADSLKKAGLDSTGAIMDEAVAHIRVAADSAHAAAVSGRAVRADSISTNTTRPAVSTIETAITIAERTLSARTQEMVNKTSEETADSQRLAAAALVISLGLATLIAFRLTRAIARPVYDLRSGMAAITEGDLTYKLSIEPDRKDEFGKLAESYSTMAHQLRQLEKLRAEFLSIASHELKTPINVILGYVELLKEGLYGPLNEKQVEVCETLTKQGQGLTRLVKRLLDISKFEAGGGRIEPKEVSLRKFLNRIEKSFQVLAHQRGINFYVTCTDDLPDAVIWDEDRMNEVLGNLLSNAFKFTDRDGTVRLEARAVDNHLQLKVCDTGAGIPTEQLAHVFEKFFQADNQESAAVEGTGLGLAIAKQIVEAHQGEISVDSTVGKGTTFNITLPMKATRTTGQFPATSNPSIAPANAQAENAPAERKSYATN